MSIRTFALAADLGGILHDPASGLTHRAPPGSRVGRHALEEARALAGPVVGGDGLCRPMPTSLCWSPLVRCNLTCPYCLDDTSVSEAGAAARWHIAGVLAASGVLGVDISGGEPLLLRDLPDLARRIAAGGHAAVSVTTNGWHLARRAERLAGALDAVRVSLDAPDADTHDTLRGAAGSFARAVEGIRQTVAAGLPVQVQTVLMAANRGHAQAMVDLAARLGAGGVSFLQMLPIGAGAAVAGQQMLDDDTAREIVAGLDVPGGFRLRLRTRETASGFAVVRADGRVWRNNDTATGITATRPLREPADLAPSDPEAWASRTHQIGFQTSEIPDLRDPAGTPGAGTPSSPFPRHQHPGHHYSRQIATPGRSLHDLPGPHPRSVGSPLASGPGPRIANNPGSRIAVPRVPGLRPSALPEGTPLTPAPSRAFHHQVVWRLTEAAFQPAARLLAHAGRERHGPIAAVVGIARGGRALAETTAAALGVPGYLISARHNPSDAIYQQATGVVEVDTTGLAAALAGDRLAGRVLLVDDVCGSGATLVTVQAALAGHLAGDAGVVTAVLCRNTGAAIDPDLWLWDVSDWVIFPWDAAHPQASAVLPPPGDVFGR
jgi:hypoxanthine phosphoribosyltransferase